MKIKRFINIPITNKMNKTSKYLFKLLLFLILNLCLISVNFAQTLDKGESKEIRLIGDTTIIVTTVIRADVCINPNKKIPYYWYEGREIHINQGGTGGLLLHGLYKCYTKNNLLIDEGMFYKGRKVGTWKNWDKNGNLTGISHWKKGLLHGKYYHYQNDTCIEIRYKKGNIINEPWCRFNFFEKKTNTKEQAKEETVGPKNE